MKRITFALLMILACAFSEACWAAYIVRVDALSMAPTPPNPVMVLGRVTSASPVTLSDGSGTVTVNGLSASVGDFLVVTGNWDGSSLTVSGTTEGFLGPARTQMIYIPAGSFLMGNNGAEPYSYCRELPQHSVNLSGYWIGKYEVTRGEYQQFMSAGGYSNSSYWSSAGWSEKVSNGRTQPIFWESQQNWGSPPWTFTQTDNHPVVGVSYYEAEAFCNWAGGHLPTDAQLEKAARWTGSYPNVYPWGNTWDAEKCNNYYDHNSAGGGYQKYQTSPVGSYPSGASPYGLQDMAGNVREWCQDWLVSYAGSSCPVDYTGSYRVLRGGGWYDSVYDYRCAYRYYMEPYYANFDIGFRLAR
ncbi:MAG: formylglycine-generating enzyme family protein [Armatimonadota bacterium]|nr:formylglycine-generating enzyme family protein [Armatimonadota bacterium]